jgi:hypothetical protein
MGMLGSCFTAASFISFVKLENKNNLNKISQDGCPPWNKHWTYKIDEEIVPITAQEPT